MISFFKVFQQVNQVYYYNMKFIFIYYNRKRIKCPISMSKNKLSSTMFRL